MEHPQHLHWNPLSKEQSMQLTLRHLTQRTLVLPYGGSTTFQTFEICWMTAIT